MTIANGNFAELLWPGINKIWGVSYNDWDPLYNQIFKVKNSDKAFERNRVLPGFLSLR